MGTTKAAWLAGVLALAMAAPLACSDDSSDGSSTSGADSGVPDGRTGADGSGSSSGGGPGPGSDASSGDGASETGGGWNPTKLSGLVLWLEGSQLVAGDGGALHWVDQSGHGNDAYVASGTAAPDHNTMPTPGGCLVFHEDSALEIADSPSLQWGTGDFLVLAVALNNFNSPGPADTGTTFTYQDGSYLRYRYGEVFSKIASGFGPGPVIVYNDWRDRSWAIVGAVDTQDVIRTTYDSNQHVLALRRKGGVLDLRIDGAQIGSAPDAGAVDVSNVGATANVGGRPHLTHFVGFICEVVAVKGTVTDADLGTLEAYAKTKYPP